MNKRKKTQVDESVKDSGKARGESVPVEVRTEIKEQPDQNGKPTDGGKPEGNADLAESGQPNQSSMQTDNSKTTDSVLPADNQKTEGTGKTESTVNSSGDGRPAGDGLPVQTENGADQASTQTKKKKHHHVWLYITGLLAAVLLLVYFGAAYLFKSHFLPNTYINGLDVAYLDAEEAESLLEGIGAGYRLQIVGRDEAEIGVITAADVNLTVDARADVDAILQSQAVYQWPNAFLEERGEDVSYIVDFDREKLREAVKSWDAMQVKNVHKPENAYISEYLPEKKGYDIIAETIGTELDLESVLSAAENAMTGMESMLDLEMAECYVQAKITSDDAKLNKKLDTLNKWAGACITYDWNGTEIVLDGDTIHEWIIEEGDTLSLDDEQITEFVKAQAKENDSYGKKRKFTTVLGVELTLPGGAYGWRTDRDAEAEELLKLIKAGSVIHREPVYAMQGAHKGRDDIGSSYVEIDLSNQHLYLFIEGQIVLETDFVSGDMTIKGRMTPPGVFGLTYKTTNAVLRGEDYETPVSYWMPFNGNVGMHDATWRRSFGGDIYLTNGSHGCINLPYSKAKEIYGYMSNGFPVICYYY